MRLRVIDRLLMALSGLILLALAVWLALDMTGLVLPVSESIAWLMNDSRGFWCVVAACAVMALLGVYGVSALFRHGKGKRGFISQKSENGEIAISVKTIEGLVTKCAQKHGEIKVQSVGVEEARNGLLIKLRASLPSGMNIPLAVGTLQKQIKQYITACSGVDVSEVRVKVEGTDRAADGSPYAVIDETPPLPVEQPEPAPMPSEAAAPVEMPAQEPETVPDERELLAHQRIFGTVEEPAMVPEPPTPEEPAVDEEAIQADVEREMSDAAESIEAEAEAAMDDIMDGQPVETDPIEEREPLWEAAAAEAEAQEDHWNALAEEAEALEEQWDAAQTESQEDDDPEAADEEEKTEE